jgi:hypothetical protein
MSISKEGMNEDILQRAGYKNLGYINGWKSPPDKYTKCNHKASELSLSRNKSLYYCDECKIYWYIDHSD